MTESVPSYQLACLFSEIGRLRSRTTPGLDHVEQTVTFLRERIGDERAAELVELHHTDSIPQNISAEVRRKALVVRAASQLASDHGRAATDEEPIRLQSVFNAVSEDEIRDTYPLSGLAIDRETLFPKNAGDHSQTAESGYEQLWNGLTDAVEKGDSYETLVHLLEKYTWCVPAFPDTPTLPLYDHLRTTAAIGVALHRSDLETGDIRAIANETESTNRDEKRSCFTLVKGDLSGIQSFLHRVKNADDAQDNIAKRMRGRSTQLWLLTESLSTLFLEQMGLPSTSVVWSGGGQFYAVVPPIETEGTSTVSERLAEFERGINTELFERFAGELSFVVGCAHADGSADSFSRLFEHVARDSDRRKLRKGKSIASEYETPIIDEWNDEPRFEPCQICGGDKPPGEDRCQECETQEAIGKKLPESKFLRLEFESDPDDTDDDQFQFGRELSDGPVCWQFASTAGTADRVYSVNLAERPDSIDPWGFVLTGKTVPYDGGISRVWSFPEQAQLARGEEAFNHVVKMDIDDLGRTISSAMDHGPARLGAIGRTLSLFFEGYLNTLAKECSYVHADDACSACQEQLEELDERTVEHRHECEPDEASYYRLIDKQKLPHEECVERIPPIYIGFSGGDDLFFVGPWDEAVDFGREIRAQLAAYCSETLTISGGFYRMKPKYPIGRAIEHAEERLDAAKAFSEGAQEKNAAWLFGETQSWVSDGDPSMLDLIDLGCQFEYLIHIEQISNSFVYSLINIADSVEQRAKNTESNRTHIGVEKEWEIKYLLSRNASKKAMNELDEKIPPALPWISVPVTWTALATR
ncbi:type III-A CRISPR-associated protein Cas10/Csm1 [Halocatena pleomorpha]|uniref:Type III-A CRISPR-associated protein Cas10/Csm1 n=1 Tax=Halocatena pleomorpha TaxID=1785090 RepID=A0A3P3R9V0_9EURY|nr:type III-A CRISPR-associated protein Cas10/Csm1 [Halocatena pleomorpha]RRJ30247.1 type III-A CRISPR-associated protein Cas10/Csm1 [Halocatena pleomorpha]